MNIRHVNLNLLIALNALLSERHVTRAADRVYLSQSTMSNSLKQLRDLFDDDLLIRGQAGNMTLTKKAKSLIEPVANSLRNLENIFHEDHFDPAESEGTLSIGMSDYVATILCPPLLSNLQKQAPKVQIVVKHINCQNYEEMLEDNQIDLVIGFLKPNHQSLMSQQLFSDQFVCFANKKHPAFQNKSNPTLKQFVSYPHVMISNKNDPSMSFAEMTISKLGEKRHIPITMPYSVVSLVLLRDTSYITILPKRFVKQFEKNQKFVSAKIPFKTPTIHIAQIWHRQLQTDPLHAWVRKAIKEIASEL